MIPTSKSSAAQRPLIFPRIAVKSRPGALIVREKEKVVDEKVLQRKVEEVPDPVTGKPLLVTVEYVEKVIETEVWCKVTFFPPHHWHCVFLLCFLCLFFCFSTTTSILS